VSVSGDDDFDDDDGIDISGPCDEAEHANDPRCTGVGDNDNSGPGSGDEDGDHDNSGPGSGDEDGGDNSGPSDNSGPGGGGDDNSGSGSGDDD
jgi:hypothetical protein